MSSLEFAFSVLFIPMLFINAMIVIALSEGIQWLVGRQIPDLLGGAMVFGAFALTYIEAMWLNCAFIINLPFASPVCQLVGF